MNREHIAEGITKLIEGDLKIKIKSPDQDLIGSKILDSFAMLLVISFIKKEFKVELQMESLDFDAFMSIHSMADLVLDKVPSSS
jgi:acyl carrier protein